MSFVPERKAEIEPPPQNDLMTRKRDFDCALVLAPCIPFIVQLYEANTPPRLKYWDFVPSGLCERRGTALPLFRAFLWANVLTYD